MMKVVEKNATIAVFVERGSHERREEDDGTGDGFRIGL